MSHTEHNNMYIILYAFNLRMIFIVSMQSRLCTVLFVIASIVTPSLKLYQSLPSKYHHQTASVDPCACLPSGKSSFSSYPTVRIYHTTIHDVDISREGYFFTLPRRYERTRATEFLVVARQWQRGSSRETVVMDRSQSGRNTRP